MPTCCMLECIRFSGQLPLTVVVGFVRIALQQTATSTSYDYFWYYEIDWQFSWLLKAMVILKAVMNLQFNQNGTNFKIGCIV